jgi:hypothetical protein
VRIDLTDGTVISDDPHPDSDPVDLSLADDVVLGWPTVALIDTVGGLDVWVVCTPDADRRDSPCADGWIEAVGTTDVGESDPSPSTGAAVWRLPIDRPYVSLAHSQDTVYLAASTADFAEDTLMAVDVTTGTVRWTAEFPNTRLHAAVIDDTLYVISVVRQTQYD